MKKFATVPTPLADACIVRMTELDQKSIVLTLDSDFKVTDVTSAKSFRR